MIKFSIITVTYNAEKTLECTVQSVLGQTYRCVEYIIIDGASKDGTKGIIEKYAERLALVKSEPDKGLYDAMNKGLAAATGDYVCFLNAGDTLHNSTVLEDIAKQIAALETLPGVVYGETALVDCNRKFVRMRRLETPEHLTWKSFRHGMVVCHQSFLAKRELAGKYDMQYRFSADIDWCIEVMKKTQELHNAHLVITDYLEEGVSTKNRRASLFERLRIMAKHYGWCTTIVMHVWFVVRVFLKK